MRILYLSLIFSLCFFALNAQDYTSKINLNKDKDYEIVSNVSNKMIMTDMEIIVSGDVVATVKVAETSDESYSLKTKIEKIKFFGEFGGKKIPMYDSENPNGFNNPEMASLFASKIGVDKTVSINRLNCTITDPSSPQKMNDEEELEKFLNADGMEVGSIIEMFFLIPAGKKLGDIWTIVDAKSGGETKTSYTLKEIKDEVASVDFNGITNIKKSFNNQGTDVFIQIQSINSGTLLVNKNTGILKKKTTSIITDGASVSMGESTPIKFNSNSVTTYSEK